jgi:chaperonin cofactor prefoldin
MQELEREKDSLQLQVTVLEDQIESQSRRIAEIGNGTVSVSAIYTTH